VSRADDITALRELADELSFTIAKAPPKRDPRRDVGALAACFFAMPPKGRVSRLTCAIRHPGGAMLADMDASGVRPALSRLAPDEVISVCIGGRWHYTTVADGWQLIKRFEPRDDGTGDEPTAKGAPIPRLPRTPRVKAA
jgi:hypothetical protein